ncbi:MAG: SEC-C domain-containing protein [Acidobacteria bacterium]|nr:SEC-C domain-containing protein [Acidobacteriota bacterium]
MFVPFAATEPPIKILAGPPDPAAPHVLAFCNRISPGARPVRLPIRAEPGCLPRECFPNVQQKVEREGGHIRYGWALWEWPRVFIEAEHHAVHEAPDGSLTDVTPSIPEDPQTARLFLPDNAAVYDFDNPNETCRDNIRQALAHDAQIEEYLRLEADLAGIRMRTPGTGMVPVSGPDAARARIQTIVKRSSYLKREIAMRHTPQGAPCFCGSGQKFKRCHGTPRRIRR